MPFHLTLPAVDLHVPTLREFEALQSRVQTQASTIETLRTSLRIENGVVENTTREIIALRESVSRLETLFAELRRATTIVPVTNMLVQPTTQEVVRPLVQANVQPAPTVTAQPDSVLGVEPVAATPVVVQPAPALPEAQGSVSAAPAPAPAVVLAGPVDLPTLVSALRGYAASRGVDAARSLMAGLGFASASAVPAERRAEVMAAIGAA